MATEVELIDTLLQELDRLSFGDETARDALIKRARMYLRRIVGEESHYITDLGRIRFGPMYAAASEAEIRSAWTGASGKLRNLLNTVKEEFQLFGNRSSAKVLYGGVNESSVFVVHGHDEEIKQSVARFVEKLGLNAVILHEKPNKGRTIIENSMTTQMSALR